MEYTGLYRKFDVNRPLNQIERNQQLKQKVRIEGKSIYELSVIRLNATYLELVDKFYEWKGFMTTLLLFSAVLSGGGGLYAMWIVLVERTEPHWTTAAGIACICGGFAACMIWLLRKESFAYTHYPIRFNRKTRMVHVFRLDGSVLSARWDDLFFCVSHASQGYWHIVGHVLDEDRTTVLESFPLPFVAGAAKSDREALPRCWELVRRYMEEGPQDAVQRVEFFLPIAHHRESVAYGFIRMYAPFSLTVLLPLGAIIAAIVTPGRWFAVRTSKVPVWPREIEDVCVVDPDDPYLRDERHSART